MYNFILNAKSYKAFRMEFDNDSYQQLLIPMLMNHHHFLCSSFWNWTIPAPKGVNHDIIYIVVWIVIFHFMNNRFEGLRDSSSGEWKRGLQS